MLAPTDDNIIERCDAANQVPSPSQSGEKVEKFDAQRVNPWQGQEGLCSDGEGQHEHAVQGRVQEIVAEQRLVGLLRRAVDVY